MTQFRTVVSLFPDLDAVELLGWIEQRWVEPEPAEAGNWVFHDVDVARVRLIYDLRREFATPEEIIPLLLSLLDQVYELRCTLNTITQVIATQPAKVQSAVVSALRARRARD